ncbi:hypothetical protein LPJ61_005825 [Coemansia biformis]|uniref:Uncharacterized protein n=1 Tax=Coemansia biformis TaxID=1286918 RepID=A0A9W7Y2F4_9FUNG|nr:hypothetical protein LPJ61_005825 [Coemansia biformis]
MDLAASWFEAVGVQVNTSKTVLLEWPQQDDSPPLVWQQGGEAAAIMQVAGLNTPVLRAPERAAQLVLPALRPACYTGGTGSAH